HRRTRRRIARLNAGSVPPQSRCRPRMCRGGTGRPEAHLPQSVERMGRGKSPRTGSPARPWVPRADPGGGTRSTALTRQLLRLPGIVVAEAPQVAVEIAHRVLARAVARIGNIANDFGAGRFRPAIMRIDI